MIQEITLISGRKVYLDECDHDPEIVKVAAEDGYSSAYHWVCRVCGERIAPAVWMKHPCGFTGVWGKDHEAKAKVKESGEW